MMPGTDFILRMLVVGTVVLWGINEEWMLFRELGKVSSDNDKYSRYFLVAVIGISVAGGSIMAKNTRYPISGTYETHCVLAVIIMATGLILRYWSIRTLGTFFRSTVMIQKGHRVVMSGPYRFIRHPSYAAYMLFIVGWGVAMENWLALICMGFLVFIGLYYRMVIEEAAMISALGEEYVSYSKRTKRIIPFVY